MWIFISLYNNKYIGKTFNGAPQRILFCWKLEVCFCPLLFLTILLHISFKNKFIIEYLFPFLHIPFCKYFYIYSGYTHLEKLLTPGEGTRVQKVW